MVETLSVIAIMGLISIGGLYGYTQVMKRHRANELLNEANKRAVMVASQLMAEKEPGNVTMDEFPTDTPYGNFVNALTAVGNDKFKMTITGLDEEVCTYLDGFSGGPIRRVRCEFEETNSTFTAELFFNKDLSTEERASDYASEEACKSPFKWCAESKICTEENTCTCLGTAPTCQVCNTTTGGYIADEKQEGDTCTTLDNKKGTCQSGECVETQACISSGECVDNTGLCPGYFCFLGSGSTKDDTWCGSDVYIKSNSGIVWSIGTPKEVGSKYLRSVEFMDWDSAKNYCEMLKKAIDISLINEGVDYSQYNALTKGLATVPDGCLYGNDCSALPYDSNNVYWLDLLYQTDCDDTTSYSTANDGNFTRAATLKKGKIQKYKRNTWNNMALCE